jgi:hypothetical protein
MRLQGLDDAVEDQSDAHCGDKEANNAGNIIAERAPSTTSIAAKLQRSKRARSITCELERLPTSRVH